MITIAAHELPNEVDVLVMGSGAAGLVAATRAADSCDRVVVLEKAPLLGGTTAVGGGVIWAPANPVAVRSGYDDSTQNALSYVSAATEKRLSEQEVSWFVDNVSQAITYLDEHTRVSLTPLDRPDYRLEWQGATQGGRSLDNDAFDVSQAPGLGAVIRPSGYFPPVTMAERDALNGAAPDPDLLAQRAESGIRTMGGALVASLLLSARDRGVQISTDAAVKHLDRDGAQWRVGVVGRGEIIAKAVVIASGGFEWSPELQQAFLPHPVTPISAPSNEGDGLKLGLKLGASVSEMTTFWGVPVITPPAQIYDGKPSGRMGNVEMTLPGSITVGADGRRFVNEALNYHDVSRVFGAIDAKRLVPQGVPAWLIFDGRYLDSYPVAGSTPGEPAEWMIQAPTLSELAEKISVDAGSLTQQVHLFNFEAAQGSDSAFARGQAAQDRFLGDDRITPNPCLRPLDEAPFYAVPLHCGTLGTSGGLATDSSGRVLAFEGAPIPGLYAAGNVAASMFRGAYPGGGATLGSAVARAFAVGQHIAGQ